MPTTTSAGDEDFHLVKSSASTTSATARLTTSATSAGQLRLDFADQTFARARTSLKITPIIDLCHFGVPDWLGNFQNPDWPPLRRVRQGVRRALPWVQLLHAGQRNLRRRHVLGAVGLVERTADDATARSSPRCKQPVQGERAGDARHPRRAARTPSSSRASPPSTSTPKARVPRHSARLQREAVPLARPDLRPSLDYTMYEYLLDNGMTRDEYHWFIAESRQSPLRHGQRLLRHQRALGARGRHACPSGEVFGYYVITQQYFEPLQPAGDAHRDQLHGCADVRLSGSGRSGRTCTACERTACRSSGFTWYSLTDQVDWDTALREDNGNVNPLGLYDLDRKIRPVGSAYKELVQEWRDTLPTHSLSLSLSSYDQHGTIHT